MFSVSFRADLCSRICWCEVAAAQEKDHCVADGKPLRWEKLLHQLVNMMFYKKKKNVPRDFTEGKSVNPRSNHSTKQSDDSEATQ